MDVSWNGPTPKSSKSLDHFCIETYGFVDPPPYIVAYLSGWWFGTWILLFHSVGNFIIPTDFHSIIFQKGLKSNQMFTLW